MGLKQSSHAEHRTVELKHAIENYTLPELAKLWASEAGVPVEAVTKTLSNAILSGELPHTKSAEIVYVFEDREGVLQSIHFVETLQQMTIPGVRPTPFNELEQAQTDDWMQDNLSSVATSGDIADPTLRLILILRDDFEAWLKELVWPLPAFWFPVDQSVKTQLRTGNQTRKSSSGASVRKAETNAIYDFWRKRAEKLRKDDSTRSLRNIAEEISSDKKLNPRGVCTETIRRKISARRG